MDTSDTALPRPEDLDGPRPYAPAKLAHVVFKTPRIEKMTAWYLLVLDAVVSFRDKRITFLTYDQEHHRLALVRVPRPLRLPGLVWSLHRKVWGFDHVAFTYPSLQALMSTYRRLAEVGIKPIWCINHGPTTSLYYEDPDGNRVELQIDNFDSNTRLLDWMCSGEFTRDPIGTEFDPDVLARKLDQGVPVDRLLQRGSAPPDNRPARTGLRNIRWKTL